MIVLRIDVRGHSADVCWTGAEAVVGSGPSAAIQRDDAGWAAREAVLIHLGDEVLLVRADGQEQWRLKPGDRARLGEALITLVGLLPLETPEAAPEGDAAGAWVPRLEDEARPAAAPTVRLAAHLEPPSPAPAAPPVPAAAPVPLPPTPAAAASAPAPPVARWRALSFEDELAEALRKSPWYAVSLGIHVVVVIALMLILPAPKRPEPRDAVYGLRSETLPSTDPVESGGPQDFADSAKPPEEPTAPDVDVPDPAPDDPKPPPVDADAARERAPGVDVELPAPEPDASSPPPIVGPSGAALRARVTPRFAAPRLGAADESVYEGEDRAQEARRRAAARVRDAVTKGGGALGRALKGLHTQDILVVRGSFDKMETVLEELGVPFTLKSPFEIAVDYDFTRHKLVFWNCGESVLPQRYREPVLRQIADFVRGGGYLFTTDWAIGTVVARAFPGYLDSTGGTRTLPDLVVNVRPAAGAERHALLEGVFEESGQAKWWLESASFDVIVRDPSRVEVLVEAPELAARPYQRSPVIAATFTYGRGRVLHVMGHYDQQKGNIAGTVGVQRLPLNFVRMRLERDAPAGTGSTAR